MDYLQALGGDVDAGLGLIIHDLVTTKALSRADATRIVRRRADEYRRGASRTGMSGNAGATTFWVAEAVQEDLIEGLGTPAQTWPICPDHPHHPLWLQPRDPDNDTYVDVDRPVDPVWTCIVSGRRIATLGQLR